MRLLDEASVIVRCGQKTVKSGLHENSGHLSLPNYRGVAQSGRVSALGAESRWFESSRPDHIAARHFDVYVKDKGDAMHVRIYRPAKNAMQSGRSNVKHWVVESEPSAGAKPDPLMGWSSSPDTKRQVKLRFDSEAAAVVYARDKGYTYTVAKRNERVVKPKAYADNFVYSRIEPWTH